MKEAGSPTSGARSEPGALFESDLTLPDRRRGKVRDVYRLPGGVAGPDGVVPDRVVMVASDRLSAFDVVMPTPIPGKGRVLTELAAFWLRFIEARGICRTHLLSTDADELPESAFGGRTTREQVRGRVTIGRLCRVIPIECVVRGYLEGSGWKEYQASGSVCGVGLPAGLRQCDRLPEPIFTPATKAEEGHDENISFDRACQLVGGGVMERLRAMSLAIYTAAAGHALARGIIIADTKFEFGFEFGFESGFELGLGHGAAPDGPHAGPILIDEALTPDSSRFWPAATYTPGRAQASYDKQFVREYLEGMVARGAWAKAPPGPELPAEVVAGTLARYSQALELLTRA